MFTLEISTGFPHLLKYGMKWYFFTSWAMHELVRTLNIYLFFPNLCIHFIYNLDSQNTIFAYSQQSIRYAMIFTIVLILHLLIISSCIINFLNGIISSAWRRAFNYCKHILTVLLCLGMSSLLT